ncbi:9758_t:CDS:1 [Ambispora gerdemannii]|uniref:9758_t:CDS:1 n=1 Tax=Ambispora gerdemannii TaxID=144530 RepID=A0A9N8VM04_9GLOM|nr:9758_t:CDS:1 [Ambispora gerdemannii]
MSLEGAEKYKNWNKEELIAKILSYENQQKEINFISKNSTELQSTADKNITSVTETKRKKDRKKEVRPFDITKYSQRHIALKVTYLGFNYLGFAAQNDDLSLQTVEGQLFEVLKATRLISSPKECNFSRCGRTDKGVSGMGQVVALDVRSNISLLTEDDKDIKPLENQEGSQKGNRSKRKRKEVIEELPYIETLNRALPDDIRVVAWAPVPSTFNARFDCKSREYKYYFAKENLNIDLMREAANKFLGQHDFRNFCKIDPAKQITNFERTILDITIQPVIQQEQNSLPKNQQSEMRDFYEVSIRGTAFLWHQVRCMMAVLFLVGQQLEKPSIIDELLDVGKYPAKPVYEMANDVPLVLYDCQFKQNIEWKYSRDDDLEFKMPSRLFKHFYEQWCNQRIKSLIIENFLNYIGKLSLKQLSVLENQNQLIIDNNTMKLEEYISLDSNKSTSITLGGGKKMQSRKYIKFDQREKCDSVEHKNSKYKSKKARIE